MKYSLRLSRWLSSLETRHSEEIQLGLSRVTAAAQKLDLLQPDSIVITVGGTNGKGSTAALLNSIYRKAGYSVAVYSSPHLIRFNERIVFNDKPIDDEILADTFDNIAQHCADIPLTYFETATLAALLYFKSCSPDITLLEVGLGGRLDACNIIDADLAVITTVDLDHQAFLGDSKELIAEEKAGIIRTGRPFIYADENMPAVLSERAIALDAPMFRNGQEYHFSNSQLKFQDKNWCLPKSTLHPNSLAAATVSVALLQKKLPVHDSHLLEGLEKAYIPGRFQTIQRICPVIIDVAHNPQAASDLAARLEKMGKYARIRAVFCAMDDKDIKGSIAPFKSLVHTWYPACMPLKRAAGANRLLTAFSLNEISVELCYNDPILALQAALKDSAESDLILVYGSCVLVGMVLEELV